MKYNSFVISLLIFFSCHTLSGQNLTEIKKLYLEGKYEEIKPAVKKLVTSTPSNASYNQWYGVCLFETGEYQASEKYLKFAASKKIEASNLYLGKLYFMQYDFSQSEEAYEKYIGSLDEKKQTKEIEAIKPLLEQAKRAARLIKYTEDIQIIDSLIVDKEEFLSHYRLGEEAGSLKESENGKEFIYTNQLENKRYYAKKDSGGIYKLYSQVKLLDKWGDEVKLSDEINSSENNCYPFVLNDGVTIYFASEGHGSIGGYDLFITRYNNNNESYLAPEQLGMPFNSTFNDYMLAIDELNEIGYFASDRFQPEGKVIIYTFIPNPEKKRVNSENQEVLKKRAKITSIKDTWIGGENYAALLQQKFSQMNHTEKSGKRDFIFVINDNIIYHNLNDFESHAAKSLFSESQQVKNALDNAEKSLEDNRIQYSKATSEGKKKLSQSIRDAEKALENLSIKYDSLQKQARNAEIKQLRQQNQ